MRILLTTLNAKYVHTSLALRYLSAFTGDLCIRKKITQTIREFTINQPWWEILGDITELEPDIVGFSCYIWNITATLDIVAMLKKVAPQTIILLGGPEVSYDAAAILQQNPAVDIIVRGEGEVTWREILTAFTEWNAGQKSNAAELTRSIAGIAGLAYRIDGRPYLTPPRPPLKDLDRLPFPYTDADLQGIARSRQIIYYESSRGCPFNCQYCLSGARSGVRFRSVERVRADLGKFIAAGIKQVKFVDRTFNCRPSHHRAIWQFLAQWPQDITTNFHFEMAADLLNEEDLDILATMPPGRCQFEIGVQSTNPSTLAAIQRQTDVTKIGSKVRQIKAGNNIHQHLDLIVGLPEEDLATLARSFNTVYSWQPDMLQIGFLKLLKGSGLRRQADAYGYIFTERPPYEVLANKWLSFAQIHQLKVLTDLFDRYYNSGRFAASLTLALQRYPGTAFDFYWTFSLYWRQQGWHRQTPSLAALFERFYTFSRTVKSLTGPDFVAALRFDYLRQGPPGALAPDLPWGADPRYQRERQEFFRDPARRNKYLSAPVRSHLEPFPVAIAAVTGLPETQPVPDKALWYLFVYKNGTNLVIPLDPADYPPSAHK